MKSEIEIDGLQCGWEPVKLRIGDHVVKHAGGGPEAILGGELIVRRKFREDNQGEEFKIQIEGLPNGWEPVAIAVPGEGEKIWTSKGIVSAVSAIHCEPALIVRSKIKKYDWSKTLDDVLVIASAEGMYRYRDKRDKAKWIAGVWQPNIHGKCPVDPNSCIIRVRFADGSEAEGVPDSEAFEWSLLAGPSMVVAWQLIRLADGVEW